MNSVIFWLRLIFLTCLFTKVFTMSVTVDVETFGAPIWIMAKTNDQRPKENDSETFDKIQPFINWNGVLKMVVPHGPMGLADLDKAMRPEVYNWDTLPVFKNGLACDSRFYEFDMDSKWDKWFKFSMIALSLLVLFVICALIARSFLTCSHRRGCHFCEDDDATATFSVLSYGNSVNSGNSGFTENSV